MPRGKNYVNNNRGVTMQASKKKNAPSMEQCFYGKGCTRANCFYRHDGPGPGDDNNNKSSSDPCMSFLAGLCTFSAAGCRKRHPPKAECERLIAKYQQMKCRYGEHCKTTGCLYIHPGDDNYDKINNNSNNNNNKVMMMTSFPPLGGGAGAAAIPPRHMMMMGPPGTAAGAGAWKPMQPTGATLRNNQIPRQQQQQQQQLQGNRPPIMSAWQPSPPLPPASATDTATASLAAPVWGGQQQVPTNPTSSGIHTLPTRSATPMRMTMNPQNPSPPLQQSQQPTVSTDMPSPTTRTPSSLSSVESSMLKLNINAKEFVPGGGM